MTPGEFAVAEASLRYARHRRLLLEIHMKEIEAQLADAGARIAELERQTDMSLPPLLACEATGLPAVNSLPG